MSTYPKETAPARPGKARQCRGGAATPRPADRTERQPAVGSAHRSSMHLFRENRAAGRHSKKRAPVRGRAAHAISRTARGGATQPWPRGPKSSRHREHGNGTHPQHHHAAPSQGSTAEAKQNSGCRHRCLTLKQLIAGPPPACDLRLPALDDVQRDRGIHTPDASCPLASLQLDPDGPLLRDDDGGTGR